ncbi:hypothetical protein AGOR_G00121380 [Albula goreensis]|uniref:Ig-like domain-containing protein n=1 Tax=Albula goreensis TaxID=1534307 RepID=A0A8T3D6R5_9TELE|nr:hypothetical protein AGOR_G00121380 [Albula goreensis]
MSVWVSPSGEPVEGSSVTLTCSSEANPPADSYTWFKTGAVASETGRGQSYTITNIRPEDSGLYHCRAENNYGALNSTAVTLTVAGKVNAFLIVTGILLPIIVAVTVIIIYVTRRKSTQRGERTQAGHPALHSDFYAALDSKSRSPDYDTLMTVRDAAKPSSSQNHETFTVYENIQEKCSAERQT